MDLPIAHITVSSRFRQDMGDIPALAASIGDVGLLAPILVTSEYQLIDGARRLAACTQLGHASIAVRVIHVPSLLRAEHDANAFAKQFTISERVAITEAITEELMAQGERRGNPTFPQDASAIQGNCPELPKGIQTRDIAAEQAGFDSDRSYRRAAIVVKHGIPALIEAMDAGTISISAAAEVAIDAAQRFKWIIIHLNQAQKPVRLLQSGRALRQQAVAP